MIFASNEPTPKAAPATTNGFGLDLGFFGAGCWGPDGARGAAAELGSAFLGSRSMASWLPAQRTGKPGRLCTGMQTDARPLPKVERQRLIESVIGRRRVGTQLELRETLPR